MRFLPGLKWHCLLYNGYPVSAQGEIGQGMALTKHHHLAQRLAKEQSYTSTPHLEPDDLF
jgi:hypothetical protein